MLDILLIGFPNSGKSSLFNILCDAKRKVSNYSGITVDSAIGELKTNSQFPDQVRLVDLPGIYSLSPSSPDEAVTIDFLLRKREDISKRLMAVIVDFDRIESSLSLALAIKEIIGDKLVLVINKDDKHAISNDKRKELQELTGLKVLSVSTKNLNIRELDRFLRDNLQETEIEIVSPLKVSKTSSDYLNEKENIEIIENSDIFHQLLSNFHSEARKIINKVSSPTSHKSKLTQKIDQVLLHPFFGTVIFFAIFLTIFNAIYEWSGPLMDLIDGGVGSFGDWVSTLVSHDLLRSLLVDGIIAGVGGVIIFAPQIGILFLLLSILEQSGYISRAAVLSDKVMSIFGLNGKAFLPFLSGFACSIPGIMAARTIGNEKERLATIFTLPLITCSARLPVYVLLIGTFVPDVKIFNFFSAQALSLFFLYFLGSFFALVIAKIFRLTMFKGETSSFFIDLPFYQRPSLRVALKSAFTKVAFFCKKAGTIILALSIVIWFASTFPRVSPESLQGKTDSEAASLQLNQSYIARAGKTLTPVLEPIGMDWRMGVGLIVSLGARELFVSTMGTIFALGEVDEESEGLRDRLRKEINPKTGEPLFNFAVAWSILIFFVFSLQCTSTIAILKRELNGWKQPIQIFTYMTILAWCASFVTYQTLS